MDIPEADAAMRRIEDEIEGIEQDRASALDEIGWAVSQRFRGEFGEYDPDGDRGIAAEVADIAGYLAELEGEQRSLDDEARRIDDEVERPRLGMMDGVPAFPGIRRGE